jgi:hypothetical protein
MMIRPRTEQLNIWLSNYLSLAELAAVHEAQGKEKVGFHYIIDQDAKLWVGRGMSDRASVDPDTDAFSIQVAYLGLELSGREQLATLRTVIWAITYLYPNIKVNFANCEEPQWEQHRLDIHSKFPETPPSLELTENPQPSAGKNKKKPPLAPGADQS